MSGARRGRKEPGPGFRLQPSLLGQRDCGSPAAGGWTQLALEGPGWWGDVHPARGAGPGPAAPWPVWSPPHARFRAAWRRSRLSRGGAGSGSASPAWRPLRGVQAWVPSPAPGCAPSGRALSWLLGAEGTCLAPRRDPARGPGPRTGGPAAAPPPRAVGQEARSGLKIAKNIRPRAAGPRAGAGAAGRRRAGLCAPRPRRPGRPRAPLSAAGPRAGPAPACRSGRFPASCGPRGPRPRRFHFCVSLAPGSARGRRGPR